MKNIIGTVFLSGILFFSAAIPAAMAGENGQEANSGFGAYFVETGHPGFGNPAQTPLLAYDAFNPADLDNIEPAGGAVGNKTGEEPPAAANQDIYGPVKK